MPPLYFPIQIIIWVTKRPTGSAKLFTFSSLLPSSIHFVSIQYRVRASIDFNRIYSPKTTQSPLTLHFPLCKHRKTVKNHGVNKSTSLFFCFALQTIVFKCLGLPQWYTGNTDGHLNSIFCKHSVWFQSNFVLVGCNFLMEIFIV